MSKAEEMWGEAQCPRRNANRLGKTTISKPHVYELDGEPYDTCIYCATPREGK